MKITFLGTNGWYDTVTGNTPSVFVETSAAYIIFDAGFGFIKAKELITSDKPVSLFISHFHLDHIIGLHTLPLFKLPQGIDVYLPRGGEKFFRDFLKRPFTTPPLLLPTKMRFHDYAKKIKAPFQMECAALRHSVPCYGFRLASDDRVVTYCTDTGLCGNLKRLAKSADLFISECALSPFEKGPQLFHLRPQTAAAVAREVGAGALALTHFDPGKYPSLDDRKTAEDEAKKIFPSTIAAIDGAGVLL